MLSRLLPGFACVVLAASCTTATPPADVSLAPTTPSESPVADSATPATSDTTAPAVTTAPLDEPFLIVDSAASSGGDGSLEAPLQRPRNAFDAAEPGTTIYFRAGTYTDTEVGGNVITNSGTPDAWITLRPFPGEDVLIDAGGEWGNGFEVIGGAYIEIDGFTIRGREDSEHGSGVFAKEEAHDIRVTNNDISGFGGAGISTIHSSRIHAEANTVRENASRSYFQGSGISIFEAIGPTNEGAPTNVIRNNYIVGNFNGVLSKAGLLTDGNCIIIDFNNETDYTGATIIENNVCIDNGGRGIHVFNSSYVTASNNTLIGNVRSEGLNGGRAEMVAADGTDIRFFNNLVINREGVAAFQINDADNVEFANNLITSEQLPPGATNQTIALDGILVTTSGTEPAGSHRPTATSPAVGAADPATQSDTDATGILRPTPGAVGALEPAGAE